MEFRWVALIALWTFLIGPILGAPSGSVSAHRKPTAAAVKPAAPVPATRLSKRR